MSEHESLKRKIIALTQSQQPLSDVAFNEHAIAVFQFQFENNQPYRRYCERRGTTPSQVEQWLDIPAVPTAAFKEAKLVAGDARMAEAIFLTSGTTHGLEKRGAHYVLELEVYQASLLPAFKQFVLPDVDAMTMVSLVPEWKPGGESSLGYMTTCVLEQFGGPASFCAVADKGIDFESLTRRLQEMHDTVCIIGTSLAFVHWFDYLRAQKISLRLPRGSRVMDTGGFKGLQRSITNHELRKSYQSLLDVRSSDVVNEYGMTEMLSQFYDSHLLDPERVGVKVGPHWVRTAVVHHETLSPLPGGETGLLRHFDLANTFSVSAIQTEDLGRATANGFELLGRASGATPRGCSIAMDMFLDAART